MKLYFIILVCSLYCVCLKGDNNGLYNSQNIFLNDGSNFLHTIPDQCKDLLNNFADSASNLTKCSIMYARPIRVCEKCIDGYVKFRDSYKALSNNTNGVSCLSLFISQDRLDVLLNYHNNILAFWEKGNCNGCYDWTADKPQISKKTIDFYETYNITKQCIKDNNNTSANNTQVCEKCKPTYLKLNNIYESFSNEDVALDTICMDVVDSMNATRAIWSKNLKCCQLRKTPEIIFLCSSSIIAVLPLLYYVMVRYCGPIRDLPNVLKQSRFKQKILRSVNRTDD